MYVIYHPEFCRPIKPSVCIQEVKVQKKTNWALRKNILFTMSPDNTVTVRDPIGTSQADHLGEYWVRFIAPLSDISTGPTVWFAFIGRSVASV